MNDPSSNVTLIFPAVGFRFSWSVVLDDMSANVVFALSRYPWISVFFAVSVTLVATCTPFFQKSFAFTSVPTNTPKSLFSNPPASLICSAISFVYCAL